MAAQSTWENIYGQGGQLNRYPYSECVAYFKRRWPTDVPKGFHALDVGCGSGVHSAFFASHGAKVTAFDFSASAIRSAQQLHPSGFIDYKTCGFADFSAPGDSFDLVFDRLSSTHSNLRDVEAFYQNLRMSIRPGGQIFWQGYTPENSGKAFGKYDAERMTWDGFTGGVFEHLGPTVFFEEADLGRIFEGYKIDRKRILSDFDTATGYNHCYWMLEMSVE